MDSFPWVDLASQLGTAIVLVWLLMQGATKFLEDQRQRDIERYKEMSERDERWFELIRSNSNHMATNNELLRTQNHLLRNVLTELGLTEIRDRYDDNRRRRQDTGSDE